MVRSVPLPSPLHVLSQTVFPLTLWPFRLWAKCWYTLWGAGQEGCTVAWITATDKKWCEKELRVFLEQAKLSKGIYPNNDAAEDGDDHHPVSRATRDYKRSFETMKCLEKKYEGHADCVQRSWGTLRWEQRSSLNPRWHWQRSPQHVTSGMPTGSVCVHPRRWRPLQLWAVVYTSVITYRRRVRNPSFSTNIYPACYCLLLESWSPVAGSLFTSQWHRTQRPASIPAWFMPWELSGFSCRYILYLEAFFDEIKDESD